MARRSASMVNIYQRQVYEQSVPCAYRPAFATQKNPADNLPITNDVPKPLTIRKRNPPLTSRIPTNPSINHIILLFPYSNRALSFENIARFWEVVESQCYDTDLTTSAQDNGIAMEDFVRLTPSEIAIVSHTIILWRTAQDNSSPTDNETSSTAASPASDLVAQQEKEWLSPSSEDEDEWESASDTPEKQDPPHAPRIVVQNEHEWMSGQRCAGDGFEASASQGLAYRRGAITPPHQSSHHSPSLSYLLSSPRPALYIPPTAAKALASGDTLFPPVKRAEDSSSYGSASLKPSTQSSGDPAVSFAEGLVDKECEYDALPPFEGSKYKWKPAPKQGLKTSVIGAAKKLVRAISRGNLRQGMDGGA